MGIEVTYLDHMGSDLTVANAARVSFAKHVDEMSSKDEKLIRYLAEHDHWSPFSHPQTMFRVKAPIFVARQLQKHTVGFAWNEVSRRYVDFTPEFYAPDGWRKKADNKKQGSSDELMRDQWSLNNEVGNVTREAQETYEFLLNRGVCPEQARMVLPQSMMTEWYWTGSLYAFARVCKLRLDTEHSQVETAEVAQKISDEMVKLFPVSWKVLVK